MEATRSEAILALAVAVPHGSSVSRDHTSTTRADVTEWVYAR